MTWKCEFYQDKRKKWRWRVLAANKNIIAESGQGYRRRIDAERMAQRVLDPNVSLPEK